jgi:methionine synthase II (cobalamin-independent)
MDFENMSEMDRAREIQKVMAQVKYKIGSPTMYYAVLINHEGDCSRTAMTACALAKALGLKSAVAGTTDHMIYYIQVDGKAYFGQNNTLNLDFPTPDNVYFQ